MTVRVIPISYGLLIDVPGITPGNWNWWLVELVRPLIRKADWREI